MTKAEAERIIRYSCRMFAEERGIPMNGSIRPNFYEFKSWLLKRHPDALDFRCRGGPMFTAQKWVDQEFNRDQFN